MTPESESASHGSIWLPDPELEFPLKRGRYEVAPGLLSAEGRLVRFDSHWARYRLNKLACRRERLDKYVATADSLPRSVEQGGGLLLAGLLAQEWPELFAWKQGPELHELVCRLSGETIVFLPTGELAGVSHAQTPDVPYFNLLDAVVSQMSEDLAIMTRFPDGANACTYLHLCAPSHWSAEDKIGRDFAAIHAPVPGIERVNRAADSLLNTMIEKGPFVRHVWGFATDERLNHHPVPPTGVDPARWRGRSIDASREPSPFLLRVERQTLIGLPEVNSALFLIRVSHVEGHVIRSRPEWRRNLSGAIRSMSPESLRYKGLEADRDAVLAWLDGGVDG